MAINAPVLQLLLKSAAEIEAPKRLVCLGYPDMLVTEDQLVQLCGADILDRVQFRDDSDSILRWHGLAAKDQTEERRPRMRPARGVKPS